MFFNKAVIIYHQLITEDEFNNFYHISLSIPRSLQLQ